MEPELSLAGEPPSTETGAPTHPVRRWEIVLVLFILAAQITYAAAFIRRSSFVIDEQRFYCLFDDAVVSMEYAKNWVLGHGPVWNEGQRVEGYTNFLWVCVMVPVHRLGLDPSTNCLIMQWIGEGLLLLNLLLAWLLGRSCGLRPTGRVLAVALLAGHYITNYWGLEGMETALLSCLMSAGFIFICRAIRQGSTSPTGLLILSLTPLVRPDSVLVLGVAALWLFVFGKRRRFLTILLAALALAPMLLHMCWRHSYYGEWLPNTYYLKATGLPLLNRLIDGINFTWFSLARSFVLWSVVAAGLFFAPSRPAGLFLATFVVVIAYQVWVGGDAWPRDRFIIPVLPGLVVAGGYYATKALTAWLHSRGAQAGLAMALAGVFLLDFNYSYFREWLLITPPYFTEENEANLRRALAIKELTDPDATVAVSWAGAPPYFADRKGVDLLGKSDPHIARLPADPDRHIPGHSKYDLNYSLEEYKPDVIATEYLDIYVDQPSFALYNRYYVEFAGRETSLWVRYDTDKVHTHRMSRAPRKRGASSQ